MSAFVLSRPPPLFLNKGLSAVSTILALKNVPKSIQVRAEKEADKKVGHKFLHADFIPARKHFSGFSQCQCGPLSAIRRLLRTLCPHKSLVRQRCQTQYLRVKFQMHLAGCFFFFVFRPLLERRQLRFCLAFLQQILHSSVFIPHLALSVLTQLATLACTCYC